MATATPPEVVDAKVIAQEEDGLAGPASGVDEKKLVTKLDRHLIPLIMLLYTFSFLDRVNIGNARLYNLSEDLGLVGNQYQIAVSILFVTYLLFEVPSNLVLKRFTPSRWIAFITVAWGIVATLTGLVNSFGSLVACRLILGALEAGLFPGLNVYLTFFYTKSELALRVGYLFVSAAIAGSLGGLLAYGVGHMQGIQGLNGWRWIMIIEGIPTFVLGILTFFLLPNDPASAYFLTDDEKKLMIVRSRRSYGSTESAQKFSKQDMMKAFKDWKVWMFCVGQFGMDTMLYGYSTFLPTIINGIGKWTSAEVQLLTIPCYFLGAVTYMTVAYLSDHHERRGIFVVIFGAVSVVGYGVLLSNSSAGVHYFGCFLVAMGLYVAVGLPLAWQPNNSPRYGKRTTANGMQLTIGNSSGIMSPFIYLTAEGPRYIRGNAVSLSMVGMATCIYSFMWFWFRRENAKRDAGHIDPAYEGLSEEELAELGDDSPHYRYTF
ncbi:putative Major facilitator superfamily domain-containing protein [Seiridium cardinale]|uniref:Major facilitator superfamily domain-containing protein n=1 Tax=Seiridium cardinale TaxID=138064 RepID=A0ABR2Y8C4_9PEZI